MWLNWTPEKKFTFLLEAAVSCVIVLAIPSLPSTSTRKCSVVIASHGNYWEDPALNLWSSLSWLDNVSRDTVCGIDVEVMWSVWCH